MFEDTKKLQQTDKQTRRQTDRQTGGLTDCMQILNIKADKKLAATIKKNPINPSV